MLEYWRIISHCLLLQRNRFWRWDFQDGGGKSFENPLCQKAVRELCPKWTNSTFTELWNLSSMCSNLRSIYSRNKADSCKGLQVSLHCNWSYSHAVLPSSAATWEIGQGIIRKPHCPRVVIVWYLKAPWKSCVHRDHSINPNSELTQWEKLYRGHLSLKKSVAFV